ncbi:MAG: hypothetical protein JYX80_14040 [Candidatus Scalindua sediminis]|nr:hypothetical protein [Candidatus Scalindua sediminis]
MKADGEKKTKQFTISSPQHEKNILNLQRKSLTLHLVNCLTGSKVVNGQR